MAARKKVLLKVIILGDSGCVVFLSPLTVRHASAYKAAKHRHRHSHGHSHRLYCRDKCCSCSKIRASSCCLAAGACQRQQSTERAHSHTMRPDFEHALYYYVARLYLFILHSTVILWRSCGLLSLQHTHTHTRIPPPPPHTHTPPPTP